MFSPYADVEFSWNYQKLNDHFPYMSYKKGGSLHRSFLVFEKPKLFCFSMGGFLFCGLTESNFRLFFKRKTFASGRTNPRPVAGSPGILSSPRPTAARRRARSWSRKPPWRLGGARRSLLSGGKGKNYIEYIGKPGKPW